MTSEAVESAAARAAALIDLERHDEAVPLLRQALASRPHDAYLLDLLAQAQLSLNADAALFAARKLIDVAPDSHRGSLLASIAWLKLNRQPALPDAGSPAVDRPCAARPRLGHQGWLVPLVLLVIVRVVRAFGETIVLISDRRTLRALPWPYIRFVPRRSLFAGVAAAALALSFACLVVGIAVKSVLVIGIFAALLGLVMSWIATTQLRSR